MTPEDIDRAILVGGSTRIPLVQAPGGRALCWVRRSTALSPTSALAWGAALQAGVLSGEEVDTILVGCDPPISLGIAVVMDTPMGPMPGMFSSIIPRNSVIPTSPL